MMSCFQTLLSTAKLRHYVKEKGDSDAASAGSAAEQLRALRDTEAKLSAQLADRDVQIQRLKADLAGESRGALALFHHFISSST